MSRWLGVFLSIIFFLNFVDAAETRKRRPRPRPRTERPKTSSRSEKPKPPAKKSNNKEALVVVEGAMVYSSASFDAPVISYLPANKKIEVSSKTYGPFYRVKLKKDKSSGSVSYGFISDVDLQILGGAGGGDRKSSRNQDVAEAKSRAAQKDEGIERFETTKPIDEVKATGLNISSVGYSENINGQEPLSNVTMFGMKFSGPQLLLPSPMDINIAMSLEPPSYYETFAVSGAKPSGYLIYADTLMQFPFLTTPNTMMYVGLGPFLSYLSAKVTAAGGVQNNTATRIGAEGMLGMAWRSGKLIVKVEGKYFYEGVPFFGATIGLLYAR